VGLLEAPSVLILIEGVIVATEVLHGIGLCLARIVVAAMASAATVATAAAREASTASVGALADPALLVLIAELLQLVAILCAVGVHVVEDAEGMLAMLAGGRAAVAVVLLLGLRREYGWWLALGAALALGEHSVSLHVRDVVGEQTPLFSLGALVCQLEKLDGGV
jgi:hypothetical protein